MKSKQIRLTSAWGSVTAELAANDAARALVDLLPLKLSMRDHMRQEKTGVLPSPLPDQVRQRDFSAGMLGLWGSDDFVIYYRSGRVPSPGIIVLGAVTGEISIFDRPGKVTVTMAQLL
ncbi:MAG: cyclophilin-like fold protein [Devosia sp.]